MILTNVERVRRRMGEVEVCQVCNGAAETNMHILRDCPAMAGIWSRLVPGRERQLFFNKTLWEWVFDNLCGNTGERQAHWPTTFAIAVW